MTYIEHKEEHEVKETRTYKVSVWRERKWKSSWVWGSKRDLSTVKVESVCL